MRQFSCSCTTRVFYGVLYQQPCSQLGHHSRVCRQKFAHFCWVNKSLLHLNILNSIMHRPDTSQLASFYWCSDSIWQFLLSYVTDFLYFNMYIFFHFAFHFGNVEMRGWPSKACVAMAAALVRKWNCRMLCSSIFKIYKETKARQFSLQWPIQCHQNIDDGTYLLPVFRCRPRVIDQLQACTASFSSVFFAFTKSIRGIKIQIWLHSGSAKVAKLIEANLLATKTSGQRSARVSTNINKNTIKCTWNGLATYLQLKGPTKMIISQNFRSKQRRVVSDVTQFWIKCRRN